MRAGMKFRDVIAILVRNGFRLDRHRGSHRQFEGWAAGKRRPITIAGNDGEDVPSWTFGSIVRQSGLPRTLFRYWFDADG